MDLDILERLSVTGESVQGGHASNRNAVKSRYNPSPAEVQAEAASNTRFSCFELTEKLTADYDILFAGRTDGTIVLWRLTQRNQFGGAVKGERREESLSTKGPHGGIVQCLTHTREGSYGALGTPMLFSGGADHKIKVWSFWVPQPSRDVCIQTLAQHAGTVTALAFGCDSSLLSCSRDGTLKIWRPQPGRAVLLNPFFCCVRSLRYAAGPGGLETAVSAWPTAVVLGGADEWTAYVGDSDGTVSVYRRAAPLVHGVGAMAEAAWDGAKPPQIPASEVSLVRRWRHLHGLGIKALHLVPEHNFLISIGQDARCRVLDYLSGSIFITVEHQSRATYTGVAWDLPHEQLLLADAEGYVECWSTYTERCLMRQRLWEPPPDGGPREDQSRPGLLHLHSARSDGLCYIGCPRGHCIFRLKLFKQEGYTKLGEHADGVVGICVQAGSFAKAKAQPPSGESGGADLGLTVVSASLDNTIRAWETVGMSERFCMRQPESELSSVAMVPGGAVLAVGADDGSIRFWQLGTGASTKHKEHANTVSALAMGKDHKGNLMMASGSYDGELGLWAAYAKDGLQVGTLPKLQQMVRRAHGGGDGHDSESEVLCLAFSGDRGLLASGGNDRSVRCWWFHTGECLARLLAHEESVNAMVAGPSDLLYSGDHGGRVILWDLSGVEQGTACMMAPACERASFQPHPSPISALGLTAEGYLVTCSSGDERVRVWDAAAAASGDGQGPGLLAEVRHQHPGVTCLACGPRNGGPLLLFAGTRSGEIVQLQVPLLEVDNPRDAGLGSQLSSHVQDDVDLDSIPKQSEQRPAYNIAECPSKSASFPIDDTSERLALDASTQLSHDQTLTQEA